MKKRAIEKNKVWIEALLGIALFVLLAYLSTFVFKRFDLTEEKRHTLTPTTIDLVKSLDDVVYIKVFLEGDFPADYQRLSQSVKEKLDEMRAYAGDKIQYEFINPSEAPDKKSREDMYGELVKKGLQYSALQIRNKDGVSEKIVFPGALISYKNREVPLQILQNQQRITDAEMINRTINNLEYQFVNALYQVQREEKQKVAFLEGHGELSAMETKDFEIELSKYYDVDRLALDGMVDALSRNVAGEGRRVNRYDAVILAKPQEKFSEQDKYIIDQFVMNGGKVLWMIDAMQMNMDSLRTTDLTMATPLSLNLDDILFNYGVRINRNLLLDRTCAPISLLTGPKGNERSELFPWYYAPILIPEGTNPIVANVDPVITEFISSIDTVETPGVRKKVILTTSESTRILKSPARVSLNIVSINPDFGNSNRPYQPVGVLLEGEFTSNFKNRLPPDFYDAKLLDFKETSPLNRMLVIADGDIAKNGVSSDGTKFRPLGFDPAMQRKMYGNRELLINSVNYLLGDASLINVRSRSVKLRKLDDEKVLQQRYYWQAINIGLPVLIIVLFGIGQWIWRRRKYSR
ncbi:gliding motility-associated ABC transporter substrate-binding protein GldG [Cryomorpha ignava]|uniref:Gliding motility-associated ABC transporter substrate-binding protein GldG n=1 Tax=Cryomorpha ignava TaxID=101383 RepID=A0A7K3WS70_9FLAO|nr:gliding motility-associated ABC transporter substrate-binding protein GldG [Cryomorpha ignava]NEN24324.1 gliding motility-associated ABC transporter substrate-binding protein GldG [Cryomorpha ignava]